MLKTSLYESHKALGAKMITFGGWEMPRDYPSGIAAEVRSCRTEIGIFDVSHMGEFRATGSEALDFLQNVTTNDVSRLTPGKGQYSLLLNDAGGVKDDIIIYCEHADDYMVVVNASCKEKDWEWLSSKARAYDAALTDESDTTALIAVQGPKARDLVQSLSQTPLLSLKRFQITDAIVADVPCRVARTGYTGEDGFEVFCGWDSAPKIWNTLVECGAAPCGLAARDVLRIEAAYPLYGHELREEQSPVGLGIGWAIKTSKLDFIGRHTIISTLQDGIRDKLVGLQISSATGIPREGQMLFVNGVEDPIGTVTSGTLSPTVGCGIALAKIGSGFAEPGTEITVDIRGRRTHATVVSLPFYRGLNN